MAIKKQIKDLLYKSSVVSNDSFMLQSESGTTFRTYVNDLPFTSNDYTTAGLATIDYVDNAIASLPSSNYNDYTTAGLATINYVDDAIASIPSSNYNDYTTAGLATTDYVDEAISSIPPFVYNDYTTAGLSSIDYVDDAISSIPEPKDYTTAGLSTIEYVDDSIASIPHPKDYTTAGLATIAYVDFVAPQPIVKNYAQLLTLISSNGLISGRWYEMSDYATTYPILGLKGSDSIQTATVEPLRLKANSVNTFEKQVYSPSFPSDIILYDITKSINERRKEISAINANAEDVVQNSYFSIWNVGNTRQYVGWFDINEEGVAPVVAGAIMIPIPLTGVLIGNTAQIDFETLLQAIYDAMTSDANFVLDFDTVILGASIIFTTIPYGNTNNISSTNFASNDSLTVETQQEGIAQASRTGLIEYRKDIIKNLSAFYDWRKVKFRRWTGTLDSIPAIKSGNKIVLQRISPWIGDGNPVHFIKPNFTGTVDTLNDLNNTMGDIPVLSEIGESPVSLIANRVYLAFFNETNIYLLDVNSSMPTLTANIYQEKDTNITTAIKAIVNTATSTDFFTFGNQSDGGLLRDIEIGKTNISDMPYNNIILKANSTNVYGNKFKQGCINMTMTTTFNENEIGANSSNAIISSMTNNKIKQITNCIFNGINMANNIAYDTINDCFISIGSTFSNNTIDSDSFIFNYIVRGDIDNNLFSNPSIIGNIFTNDFNNNRILSLFNNNVIMPNSGILIRLNVFADTGNGVAKIQIFGNFSYNRFENYLSELLVVESAYFVNNWVYSSIQSVNILDNVSGNKIYVDILNVDINTMFGLLISDKSPDGSVWYRTISDSGDVTMTKVIF
jgi:hypothetical protein